MASLERNLPLETYELSVRASKRQMSSLILPDAEENVTAIPCSKMTRFVEKAISSEYEPLGNMPAAHFLHFQLLEETAKISYVTSDFTK